MNCPRQRLICAAVCVISVVSGFSRTEAQAQPTGKLRGVAVDEQLDQDPVLLPALPRSTADLPPLVVRLALPLTDSNNLATLLTELDRRLAAYAARNVAVVLRLGAFPESDTETERWRELLRTTAEHARGKVVGYQVGTFAGAPPAADRYVFLLKLASVQLRSVDPDALVIQGSLPASASAWQAGLYAAGIAPYVDGVALLGADDDDVFRASVERFTAIVEREDSMSAVILGPMPLGGSADQVPARFFGVQMRSLGTRVQVTSVSGAVPAIRSALTVAARAADLLSGNLVTVDEPAAGLRFSRASADVTARVPHKLLFSTSSFATFLIYGGMQDTAPVDVDISVAGATAPQVRDALAGSAIKPTRAQAREGTRISLTVPAARHPLILDFNADATDRFTASADVQRPTLPSVGEIVARHQQAQAAQDAAASRYMAHLRLEQHFHPSPADPAWNVVTENRMFADRGAVEWEELSFSLNGATWTSNRPPFPLVQPEKVLSLPLDLRLNQDYVYRLDGVDTVAGHEAYVVRFEPASAGKALYRGTVWIDRQEYVRLKVQAVETQLSGMVVSNDETHTYSRVGERQGRSIWLLDRLSSKQMFLMAGRTVLVEREAHITDVVLTPDDYESELREAHASNRIMYRDTEQGLRYLVKRGEMRVVSNQMTTSTKALALGAQVDPSFDYPLPIGGLDVLDFNFLNKDMQFALLFAGVFGAGNIQRANMLGGRVDASVDFFYLAAKSNDSVFDAQGERTAERVLRMPASTGFNIGYQATAFQKILGHYEFRYDAYSRDEKTAAEFVTPSSTGTHGIGAGYEYRRGGYSLVANVMRHRQIAEANTYTKYDIGASKDFVFATFHTIHLNGAYFSGDRLDRFSMYQFGMFDPARMHGVPSAVRFAELAVFRGSYSFNLFDQYRVDLFVDHARGRDAGRDDRFEPVTGLGLGLNLRAPRNTILRVDIGKSFLPDRFRGAGSTVLQIMLLKPL